MKLKNKLDQTIYPLLFTINEFFSILTIFWHRRRFSMNCFNFSQLEGEIFGTQFTRTLFKTSRQKWDGLAQENGILSRSTPNTLESHLCHEFPAQRNFLTWKLVQPLLNFFLAQWKRWLLGTIRLDKYGWLLMNF